MRVYGFLSLFCGLGGNARGILQARSQLGSRFESVGAFDLDPEACADFRLLTGSEAQRVDLEKITAKQLAARCRRRPDMVFLSAPCKGFSGCLPEKRAGEAHYQRLNALAKRGVKLVLDAWREHPPALILFENVPRIATRGRDLLEELEELLGGRGYLVDRRVHDCGELGGLAQRRERYLLAARLPALAPTSLHKPPSQRVRSIGEVLWRLPVPVPGPSRAGAMHELPKLSELNWLRLACIRAGQDWRDLPRAVALQPAKSRHSGIYGVGDGDEPSHTVIGQARAGKGWASVGDPRLGARASRHNGGFGVHGWGAASGSVLGEGSVRNTASSVADPRLGCAPRQGTMGVAGESGPISTVLGRAGIHNGVAAVCDPRSDCGRREGALGVARSGVPLPTSVIGHGQIHNGPWQVADPRVPEQFRGAYGVQDPIDVAACVRAGHRCRTAPAAVADGRGFEPSHRLICDASLEAPREAWIEARFILEGPVLELARRGRPTHVVISAPDGTVHRPLTTLELAVLQGFSARFRPGEPVDLDPEREDGKWLELTGNSNGRWRERIGNAVPPPAARAMGEEVLEVLDAGAELCFRLSSGGIWVAPAARSTTQGRTSPPPLPARSTATPVRTLGKARAP